MRNIALLSLVLLAGTLGASGRALTPAEALHRAGADATLQGLAASRQPRLLYTARASADAQPALYVMAAQGGRALVVSADDCAAPLLGWLDDAAVGSASQAAEALPETLRWWLQEYARQIEWARQNGLPAYGGSGDDGADADGQTGRLQIADTRTWSSIEPLVQTRWNQKAPYWDACPTYTPSSGPYAGTLLHCLTGCVATAASQVMRYHCWPAAGTGTAVYTPKIKYPSSASGTATHTGTSITYDYSQFRPAWDQMPYRYVAGDYTAAQAQAVAQLMWAVGTSVNMVYGTEHTGGSSAAVRTLPRALIDHFGYSAGARILNRDFSCTRLQWETAIYESIRDGMPVIYSGTTQTGGGHAFVCDGYSSGGYFHINWGWSGTSDGYFRLAALDPHEQGPGAATGSGYNYKQDVVLGLRPPVAGETPQRQGAVICTSLGTFTRSGHTVTFSYTDDKAKRWNYGSQAGTGVETGLMIEHTDGTVAATVSGGTVSGSWDINYSKNVPSSVTLPSSLADGTYYCYLAYRLPGGQWQHMLTRNNATRYYELRVAQGSITMFKLWPDAGVTVRACTVDGTVYADTPFRLDLTLKAANYRAVDTDIRAVFSTDQAGANVVARCTPMPVEVPGNASAMAWQYVSGFNNVTLSPGQYYVNFYDAGGNHVNASGFPVTVQAAPTQSAFTVEAFTVGPHPNRDDIQLTATISCQSGVFARHLYAYILAPGETVEGCKTFIEGPVAFISPGQTETFTWSGSYPAGESGQTYTAVLRAPDLQNSALETLSATLQPTFTLGTVTAIDGISADTGGDGGDDVAEYYDLQGVRVDRPVKGRIYIVRRGGAAPARKMRM